LSPDLIFKSSPRPLSWILGSHTSKGGEGKKERRTGKGREGVKGEGKKEGRGRETRTPIEISGYATALPLDSAGGFAPRTPL